MDGLLAGVLAIVAQLSVILDISFDLAFISVLQVGCCRGPSQRNCGCWSFPRRQFVGWRSRCCLIVSASRSCSTLYCVNDVNVWFPGCPISRRIDTLVAVVVLGVARNEMKVVILKKNKTKQNLRVMHAPDMFWMLRKIS